MPRHNVARAILSLASLSLVFACDPGLSGAEAEAELSARIILPNEGETLDDPAEDDSVTLDETASGGSHSMQAGDSVTVRIPFSSSNANVVGAGIRFGDSGPVRTVMIDGASGQGSGTLEFDFQVPPDICDQLSDICHDIKCYEFAVTDVGTVSRANINNLAMACGGCDEPSCKELLDQCLVGQCQSGVACDDGTPIDSCVEVAFGGTPRCWYQRGDERFLCDDCNNLEPCAQAAVDSCINAN
jgi:hypothetical protein